MRLDTDTSRNGSGRVALAIVAGAAVGAAFGLLFAPKEGRTLRRDIRAGAERVARETRTRYQDASRTVGDLVTRSKNAIEAGRRTLADKRGETRPMSRVS